MEYRAGSGASAAACRRPDPRPHSHDLRGCHMARVALVIALAASAGQFAPVTAQDSKEGKPAASLKGGDPTPPLKVSKWL